MTTISLRYMEGVGNVSSSRSMVIAKFKIKMLSGEYGTNSFMFLGLPFNIPLSSRQQPNAISSSNLIRASCDPSAHRKGHFDLPAPRGPRALSVMIGSWDRDHTRRLQRPALSTFVLKNLTPFSTATGTLASIPGTVVTPARKMRYASDRLFLL